MTNKLTSILVIWAVLVLCNLRPASAEEPFLLGPPQKARPIVVLASFQLRDINEIDEQAETFAFSGVMTLVWKDERLAFDPAAAGVDEKVYLGAYQFNEVATGWFPQVVLVNEAGAYDKHGVVLRVKPDGTQTLVETLNAVAKTELNLRRFPLDRQRLEAVFEVLGYDASEVVLRPAPEATPSMDDTVRLPQWSIEGIEMSTRERSAPYAGRRGVASAWVMSVDVQRESFFISRLVIVPLIVIVLLSFSVFWMDRSGLGDRINVSFIGLLTGVAYQLVMSEILPRISYVTLVHGFTSLSFLAVGATVVVNLVVGALDRNHKSELAARIDRRCRWLFPLGYFGLLLLILAVALVFF